MSAKDGKPEIHGGNNFLSQDVADKLFAQMKALDAAAEERERLKRETMDGCRLFKGLEVFTVDDPFYSAVIVDPKRDGQMSMVKSRRINDRRKKFSSNIMDRFIYVDQIKAFSKALIRHDETDKDFVCNINDAEKIKSERAEKRLELLDGMAIVINKRNRNGIPFKMKSKKYKGR